MSGVPHWILNAGNEKLRRYATDAMTHQTRTWAKEELERRESRRMEQIGEAAYIPGLKNAYGPAIRSTHDQICAAMADYVAVASSSGPHVDKTEQEAAPMDTTIPAPELTITQRPLVQMRDRAITQEQFAKWHFERARKNYQKAKAERLLIETDLKKIGWILPQAPIAAKPAKPAKAKKS